LSPFYTDWKPAEEFAHVVPKLELRSCIGEIMYALGKPPLQLSLGYRNRWQIDALAIYP